MAKRAKKNRIPSYICFNARGAHALPYASSVKSKSPTYCEIPSRVIAEIAHMFGVESKVRCIKRTGANNCDVLAEVLPSSCMRGWRITGYLGSGVAGYVFGCRRTKDGKSGALKIQRVQCNNSMRKELNAHRAFARAHLSPEMLCHSTTRLRRHKVAFINMKRIDTTVDYWLEKKHTKKFLDLFIERLFSIIKLLSKRRYTHGDFHTGNIGFVYNRVGAPGKIQILDHSYATMKGSLPEIEIVQFMRTLHRRYNRRADRTSSNYLLDRCKEEAKRQFGLDISRSLSFLEQRFSSLRSKLRRMKSK